MVKVQMEMNNKFYLTNFKNKTIPWSDGKKLYFLAGVPVENSDKQIWLTNTTGTEANYSLWYTFIDEDENVNMEPYKETDSEYMLIKLLELFLETAYD
jgi:hypothetical protein